MTAPTRKLKKILVASDLLDQSGLAVRRGIELGIEHNAEVIIAHIVDEGLPDDAQSALLTTSDHYIRSLLRSIPHSEQVAITIDIVVGRADIDIVERALIEEANMIVIGLHNRILEENLSIEGTIGEQIIHATNMPVLVTKTKPKGAYRVVVVGVDFSIYSSAGVRAAIETAPGADIHLIHAYEDDPGLGIVSRFRDPATRTKAIESRRGQLLAFIEAQMQDLIRGTNVSELSTGKVHHLVRQGRPHDVLKQETERLGAELLVLGTHGRLGLARTFAGSVTTDLLNDRLCDVLVIRPY